ncbi:hypothetical protein EZS27_023395 [termite gut metagenome]|uniref:Arm DNA-binding domain-containing protein n=1 Tax=termite gut metagenome TaxID=433724 RepID=A0A5J4R1M8_9ZZZZ
MNTELKVSFYLKRKQSNRKVTANSNPVYPIVGKIIIGKTLAQFSTKLKVEERLWHVKSGRMAGKSHVVTELNREINKINLSIHTHYREILERTGKVTASQVKNAFQGIATAQKTLIALFEEIMQEFHSRIGWNMNFCSNRQSFNILTKSENSIPRFIPKSIFAEFQSFALFQ